MTALALVLTALALPAPGGFSARVTNPYFPLRPGMRWVYRGVDEGKRQRNVVDVTDRVVVVAGAPCAVIHDRVFLDGHLAEETLDYYSQDARGTVWYFGEDTHTLDSHGRVISTEGSWRAGVDGARQGIYMPPHPRVGQRFQQEHYPGHAEDRFKVLGRHASVQTPFRDFRRRALLTEEWTPLEPGVRDRKWYVRGIGQVREASAKGPRERADLVSFQRR